ncbi:hypothetical protein LCGC14_2892410, partial [marine sediment metagenome]
QYTVLRKPVDRGAFSKVVASNMFADQHKGDPKGGECDYIVCLDNDMIVTPGWDSRVNLIWRAVIDKPRVLGNTKIIGQIGIMSKQQTLVDIGENERVVIGKKGGSGFWVVLPNFFEEWGRLNIRHFIGKHKGYDGAYWAQIEKTHSGVYTAGIDGRPLVYHCGDMVGSVCLRLEEGQVPTSEIAQRADEQLGRMDFAEFYEMVEAYKPIRAEHRAGHVDMSQEERRDNMNRRLGVECRT